VRWVEHCGLVQQSWNDSAIKTNWYAAEHSKVLVIDDLDKKTPSDWSLEKLFELSDYRYTQQLPTIFTSNLSLEGLKTKNAGFAPIISRVFGQTFDIIEFTGQDYRLSV